jgi:hypothetical protein
MSQGSYTSVVSVDTTAVNNANGVCGVTFCRCDTLKLMIEETKSVLGFLTALNIKI